MRTPTKVPPRRRRARGPKVASASSDGFSRSTLTRQLEDALRSDIVEGRLGAGEHLTVAEITRRYHVSPTPAREALASLSGEGFVQLHSQHSPQITPVSASELDFVYKLRLAIEPDALVASIRRARSDWDGRVSAAMKRLTSMTLEAANRSETSRREQRVTAWSEAHRALHFALLENESSPLLTRILTTLYHHAERYRLRSEREISLGRSLQEHQEIVRAAIARDESNARAALVRHLQETVRLLTAEKAPRRRPAGARRRHGRGRAAAHVAARKQR